MIRSPNLPARLLAVLAVVLIAVAAWTPRLVRLTFSCVFLLHSSQKH